MARGASLLLCCLLPTLFHGLARGSPAAPNPSIEFSSDISLSWSLVNYTNSTPAANAIVEFTLTLASGVGWGSIGFAVDHDNTMDNKDYIFASYSGGQAQLSDRFNERGKVTPPVDGQQDLTLVRASTVGGSSVIVFRRKADTGDTWDVPISNPVGVTWAVGPGTASGPAEHNSYSSAARVVNFIDGSVGDELTKEPIWQYIVFFGGLALLVVFGAVLRCFHPGSRSVLHGRPIVSSAWLDLTVAEWIFYVAFLILLALWLLAFFKAKKTSEGKFARPFGYGLLPVMAIALFPVSRRSPVLRLLGTDYLRALRFHRFLGTVAFAFMLVHGIGMLVAYRGGAFEWTAPRSGDVNPLPGFISGAVLVLVMGPAAFLLRRSHWDLFQLTHVVGFVAVVVCGVLHYVDFVWYLILPLALYLVDWALRLHGTVSVGAATVQSVAHGGGVVAVQLAVRRALRFEPGAHVYVNVPRVSRTAWHPFSLSCCQEDTAQGTASLHVKDMGPGTFTNSLVQSIGTGERVLLDGPYGQLSVPLPGHPAVLLVAGGVGITPMASILASCLAHGSATASPQRVALIWTVQSEELLALFQEPIVRATKQSYFTFDPVIHVTRSSTTADSFGLPVTFGRPDFPTALRRVAGELASPGPHPGAQDTGPIAMYICGPEPMMRAAEAAAAAHNSAAAAGVPTYVVHRETFYM